MGIGAACPIVGAGAAPPPTQPHIIGTLLLPPLLHLPWLRWWLLMRYLLGRWLYHTLLSCFRILEVTLVLLVRLLRHELHLRNPRTGGRYPAVDLGAEAAGGGIGAPAGQPWKPGGPMYGLEPAPATPAGRAADVVPGAATGAPGGTDGREGPTIPVSELIPATTSAKERWGGWTSSPPQPPPWIPR
jgi:hypothetical protein